MTIRQAISNIRSALKLTTSDYLITDRYLASELNITATVLVKRETNLRKLLQSPNLFTTLPCLEMKEVPIGECCDYTAPRTVSKSVEEIPDVAEGIWGLLVQNATSIDTLLSFKESNPRRYANALKLGLTTELNVYWIFNKHIYTSNPKLRAMNFSAYFEDDVPNHLLYPPDCPCLPGLQSNNACQNPLDRDMKCPGYLEKAVQDMVIEKLGKTFLALPDDKTSDNKDDNR